MKLQKLGIPRLGVLSVSFLGSAFTTALVLYVYIYRTGYSPLDTSMRPSPSLLLAASSAVVGVVSQSTPDPFQKYTISAPGINASFIAYGARLTNLYVNDKNGNPQDVVLGYVNGCIEKR